MTVSIISNSSVNFTDNIVAPNIDAQSSLKKQSYVFNGTGTSVTNTVLDGNGAVVSLG